MSHAPSIPTLALLTALFALVGCGADADEAQAVGPENAGFNDASNGDPIEQVDKAARINALSAEAQVYYKDMEKLLSFNLPTPSGVRQSDVVGNMAFNVQGVEGGNEAAQMAHMYMARNMHDKAEEVIASKFEESQRLRQELLENGITAIAVTESLTGNVSAINLETMVQKTKDKETGQTFEADRSLDNLARQGAQPGMRR